MKLSIFNNSKATKLGFKFMDPKGGKVNNEFGNYLGTYTFLNKNNHQTLTTDVFTSTLGPTEEFPHRPEQGLIKFITDSKEILRVSMLKPRKGEDYADMGFGAGIDCNNDPNLYEIEKSIGGVDAAEKAFNKMAKFLKKRQKSNPDRNVTKLEFFSK